MGAAVRIAVEGVVGEADGAVVCLARVVKGPVEVGDGFDRAVLADGSEAPVELRIVAIRRSGVELRDLPPGVNRIELSGMDAEALRGVRELRGRTEGPVWVWPADQVPWQRAFNAMIEDRVVTRENGCPECGTGTLYLAFSIDGPESRWVERGEAMCGVGRHWQWCAQCSTAEYYCRAMVPEWARAHVVAEVTGWRDPREVVRLLGL
ncbi:hypothetical protein ACGFX4_04155 [Kitasatospora sp. NPDC048365]|uniref:hypothetical protein n=1 Tax=Kitasatospora sp. NPDC048365 TaxID=3364050 RepID=UPI003713F42E